MFIKIIKNDPEGKGNTLEMMYECKNIVYTPHGQDSVTVALDEGEKMIELDKAVNELYVLNDEGKTIDKYKW